MAARACTGPVSSGLFAFVRSLLQSVRIQTSLKLAASLSTLLGKNSYHGRTQQPRLWRAIRYPSDCYLFNPKDGQHDRSDPPRLVASARPLVPKG